MTTLTMCQVPLGCLCSFNPQLLANLFRLFQEVADNTGLLPNDPLPLVDKARSIPLPMVPLTWGGIAPLLLLAAISHLPLLCFP
jgi:hypothetical protein